MEKSELLTNPKKFLEIFDKQVQKSDFDKGNASFERVVLTLLWMGLTSTRQAILQASVNSDLGFLCFNVIKSFLPIIQNLRLGYSAAVIVLLRSQMEQVALLGYLLAHPEYIPKYRIGIDMQKESMRWAGENTVENWMFMYGLVSKVAHPFLENTSTQMFESNEISMGFRDTFPILSEMDKSLDEELTAGVFFTFMALESYIDQVTGSKLLAPEKIINYSNGYFSSEDLITLQIFLKKFIAKHQ